MVGYIVPHLVDRRLWNRHGAPPRACNGVGKIGRWIVQLRQDHRVVAFAQREPYTPTPTSEGAQKWQTLPRRPDTLRSTASGCTTRSSAPNSRLSYSTAPT